MKRTIKRQFDLTEEEVRAAIYDWLKAQDIPVPASPREMYVEGISDAQVNWTDTADIEPRK